LNEFKTELDPNHIGKSLYLHGTTEDGKTLYAANLLINSARENWTTNKGPVSHKFVSIPELFDRVKRTYDKERATESEGQVIDEMIQTDFLVLDDLGAERVNDWVLQFLYLVINNRYEDLKLTVFTSNLALDELEEALGNDRIPSRINAMCEIVNFGDKDLRVKNKNG
jgi:DNA replication protein DnaC